MAVVRRVGGVAVSTLTALLLLTSLTWSEDWEIKRSNDGLVPRFYSHVTDLESLKIEIANVLVGKLPKGIRKMKISRREILGHLLKENERLELGYDINELDDDGLALVHQMVIKDAPDLFDVAWKHGMNLEQKSAAGETAIAIALRGEKVKAGQWLRRKGAKLPERVGKELTMDWIFLQDNLASLLIALPDKKDRIEWQDEFGNTMAHRSSKKMGRIFEHAIAKDRMSFNDWNQNGKSVIQVALESSQDLKETVAKLEKKYSKIWSYDLGTNVAKEALKLADFELFAKAVKKNRKLTSAVLDFQHGSFRTLITCAEDGKEKKIFRSLWPKFECPSTDMYEPDLAAWLVKTEIAKDIPKESNAAQSLVWALVLVDESLRKKAVAQAPYLLDLSSFLKDTIDRDAFSNQELKRVIPFVLRELKSRKTLKEAQLYEFLGDLDYADRDECNTIIGEFLNESFVEDFCSARSDFPYPEHKALGRGWLVAYLAQKPESLKRMQKKIGSAEVDRILFEHIESLSRKTINEDKAWVRTILENNPGFAKFETNQRFPTVGHMLFSKIGKSDFDLIELLISNGMSLTKRNLYGSNLYDVSCSIHESNLPSEVRKRLKPAGLSYDCSDLPKWFEQDYSSLAEFYDGIKRKKSNRYDPMPQELALNYPFFRMFTLLELAILIGDDEMAERLFKDGANPRIHRDYFNDGGFDTTDIVARYGSRKIRSLFQEKGLFPRNPHSNINTVIESSRKDSAWVRLADKLRIKSHCEEVSSPRKLAQTLSSALLRNEFEDHLQATRNCGFDPMAADELGNTVLFYANDDGIFNLLHTANAEWINHRNQKGTTALMWQLENEPLTPDSIKRLVDAGAELHFQDDKGNNLAHLIVSSRYPNHLSVSRFRAIVEASKNLAWLKQKNGAGRVPFEALLDRAPTFMKNKGLEPFLSFYVHFVKLGENQGATNNNGEHVFEIILNAYERNEISEIELVSAYDFLQNHGIRPSDSAFHASGRNFLSNTISLLKRRGEFVESDFLRVLNRDRIGISLRYHELVPCNEILESLRNTYIRERKVRAELFKKYEKALRAAYVELWTVEKVARKKKKSPQTKDDYSISADALAHWYKKKLNTDPLSDLTPCCLGKQKTCSKPYPLGEYSFDFEVRAYECEFAQSDSDGTKYFFRDSLGEDRFLTIHSSGNLHQTLQIKVSNPDVLKDEFIKAYTKFTQNGLGTFDGYVRARAPSCDAATGKPYLLPKKEQDVIQETGLDIIERDDPARSVEQ